jgi:hypothetical protein
MVAAFVEDKLKRKTVKTTPTLTKARLMQERSTQTLVEARAKDMESASTAASEDEDTTFVCDSVHDWLLEEGKGYSSLHVRRPQTWDWAQEQVDIMARKGAFGEDEALMETVHVHDLDHQQFSAELCTKACCLTQRAVDAGLPALLGQQIRADLEEVGMVMAQLLPDAEHVILKVELVGLSSCKRWHQDKYTSRAIITYVGRGTDYTGHSNVDFYQLENRGKNETILHDQSEVFSTSAGDIFLIKGKLFPSAVSSLVHKSPGNRYHANGEIMHRVCVKLDVK